MRIKFLETDGSPISRGSVAVAEVTHMTYNSDDNMAMFSTHDSSVDIGIAMDSSMYEREAHNLFEMGVADLTTYGYATYFEIADKTDNLKQF